MLLKNFNFNQKPRLLINGVEYTAENIFQSTHHIFNKSAMTIKGVWYKDERDRQTNYLKFEPFTLVEVFFGNDLSYFGIIKNQSGGTLSPFANKAVDIQVIGFQEWLTHKSMDFPIIRKSPEWVVRKIVSTLNEKRIVIGQLNFAAKDDFVAYNTKEKDAYQVLRMVEKHTQSILQVTPNDKGQLEINFYDKVSNALHKHGVDLDIDTVDKYDAFMNKYGVSSLNWTEDTKKYANEVRGISEKAIAEQVLKQEIDLSSGNETYRLLKNVGSFEKKSVALYTDNGVFIRRLNVVTKEDASKGKANDISFAMNDNSINIANHLVGKNQKIQLSYYPIERISFQRENKTLQNEIAQRSDSNGVLRRLEKHNDITNPSDLLAIIEGYLSQNSKPRISLNITAHAPIWDIGEHTVLTNSQLPDINGDYIVSKAEVRQIIGNEGNLFIEIKYELINSTDFEEALNKYDSQSYRDNPIYGEEDFVFSAEEVIDENLFITIKNFKCEAAKIGQQFNAELNMNLNPLEAAKYGFIKLD